MKSAIRTLSERDLEDLIEGAIVLGCGGGGDPQVARDTLQQALSQGKEFSLLDPEYLKEESWVCILGYVGGGVDPEEMALTAGLPRIWDRPILQVAKELANYLQVDFESYLCSEIGAGNTIANLFVGAMQGKPVLDGDAAGKRAKPELSLSLTNITGVPVAPLAAATHYGDVAILKNVRDEVRAEQLCRYLARASGGRLAVARCPAKGGEIKKAVYPHSISLAIEVGKAIRQTFSNPVQAIADLLGCEKIFEGEVQGFSKEGKSGFVWGDIFLKGLDWYRGQKYRIWFKNENLIAWRDDKLDITCPDHIIILDAETGRGMYNWGDQFKTGRKVSVLGMRSADIWRTKKGLETFGPRHFGLDLPSRLLGEK